MALDRSFHLRKKDSFDLGFDPKTLTGLIQNVESRHVIINSELVRKHGGEELSKLFIQRVGQNSVIYLPPTSTEKLVSVLTGLLTYSGNIYEVLYRHGSALITPWKTTDDEVILSGGSYSTVGLELRQTGPIIHKLISKGSIGHEFDTILRLHNEGRWLAELPSRARELFPSILAIIENDIQWGYEMEFFPWGSLAEMVFQNCIDGEQLFSILKHIYLRIAEDLYSFSNDDNSEKDEETYLEKIKRRTEFIQNSDYSPTGILRTLFAAPWVEVNGVRCCSQEKLIDILVSKPEWAHVIRPPSGQLVHGDLILEDILVNLNDFKQFKLIDPNPSSSSILRDVAKTMLSLWLGYEFYYYDLFNISSLKINEDGGIRVEIDVARSDCIAIYKLAADRFFEFIKDDFCDLIGLDPGQLRPHLRMASALQALAIPMFHLLHHKKEMRAFAFACVGLYHAQLALEGK